MHFHQQYITSHKANSIEKSESFACTVKLNISAEYLIEDYMREREF